jgi:hypothetical protein
MESLTRQYVAAALLALTLITVALVLTAGHPSCVGGYLRDHGWHVGSPASYCKAVQAVR